MKTKEEIIKQFMELFNQFDNFYGFDAYPIAEKIAIKMAAIILGKDLIKELMEIFEKPDKNCPNEYATTSASSTYFISKEEMNASRLDCAEECYELYKKYNST